MSIRLPYLPFEFLKLIIKRFLLQQFHDLLVKYLGVIQAILLFLLYVVQKYSSQKGLILLLTLLNTHTGLLQELRV